MHIGNTRQYTNKCRAKDKGPPIQCQYRKCEDCGAVFIRVEEHQAWTCFAHRPKPGDAHKPASAPPQDRPAEQRTGGPRQTSHDAAPSGTSSSVPPRTQWVPRPATAQDQARLATLLQGQGAAPVPQAEPFQFGTRCQAAVSSNARSGFGAGALRMTTPL